MLIAVLAAIVLAQEAVPTAPSESAPSQPPPPPAPAAPPATAPTPLTGAPPGDLSAVPPLPEGPMLAVARSDKGETFLVVNRVSKTGEVADFWTYEAFIPAVEISPGVTVVQGLARHQVNCVNNTDQTVASAGYDETGTAVVALAASPANPLVEGSVYRLVANVVCKGVELPKDGQIQGHAAALAAARATPGA
jgi:hypothetical protein